MRQSATLSPFTESLGGMNRSVVRMVHVFSIVAIASGAGAQSARDGIIAVRRLRAGGRFRMNGFLGRADVLLLSPFVIRRRVHQRRCDKTIDS